jgi:predicted transcriptional regulator
MTIELSYILESNIKKYIDEKNLQETGIVLLMNNGNTRCYDLTKRGEGALIEFYKSLCC